MNRKLNLIISIIVAITTFPAAACQSQTSQTTYPYPQPLPARPNTAAGAVVGGASGSLIGAAIGSNERKTGEGALIGGLIGAAAGSLLGKQADRAEELRRYDYQQQRVQAQRSAITLNQVVQMSQNGLSPSVIINQINSQGVWARPTANDLIALKQSGVSDDVIAALQTGRYSMETSTPHSYRGPVVVERAPVFVEPVIVAPAWRVPSYYPHSQRHYHGPRYGHRGTHGAHGGIRINF